MPHSHVQADAAASNDHGETALDLATGTECAELLKAASASEQVQLR